MKKEGFVAPIIVLTVICLVVAGLLAYVNSITAPVIAVAAAEAEEEAKKEVLPEADSFTTVEEDLSDCPGTLESAYVADNGAGAVFILSGPGYGGQVQIIVGIGSDETITGTKVLDHSETAGLGARITQDKFRDQFIGQDSSLSGVTLISGSTVSSKAFRGLVEDAFTSYEVLAGKGVI